MHEYALMGEVIKSILDRLAEEKEPVTVTEVTLQVGLLEVHSAAAARQAFQVLARGTPLESATLSLKITPAQLHCGRCGYAGPYMVDHIHGHDPLPMVPCPHCGGLATLTGGRGITAIDLVLD